MGIFGVVMEINILDKGYKLDFCCGDMAHMERMSYVVFNGENILLGVQSLSGEDFQQFPISFCPVCGAAIQISHQDIECKSSN